MHKFSPILFALLLILNGRFAEGADLSEAPIDLPDLKTLFKEIDEHQTAIDKKKEQYSGTRRDEETMRDKNGKVVKRESKEYTFYYLNGTEISTLVKRDGKTLNAAEQKKENERSQKEILSARKRAASKKTGAKKEDEDIGIETFLRICEFGAPRREHFHGRSTLVFDFEPNPKFKAKTTEERMTQKLAGTIRVDEKARVVTRIDAHFVSEFKITGGLVATVQPGSSFIFDQAPIDKDSWLPTRAEAQMNIRAIMVKTVNMNTITEYSNYKKSESFPESNIRE